MTGYHSTACGADGHCITCSDEAFEMRVMEPAAMGLARCTDPEGRDAEIEVTLVGDIMPGDLLLVHAGVAIARLPAKDAP